MFGFVFGTACLIGLAFLVARGRRLRRFGGPGGRRALYHALARLETTPGQEKAIVAALDQFAEAARAERAVIQQSREATARALRGENLDEAPLREAFQAQDAALARLREAFAAALRDVHEVLNERQRSTLGELVQAGVPFHAHHHCGGHFHRHGYGHC